jgi:hypothetical protein
MTHFFPGHSSDKQSFRILSHDYTLFEVVLPCFASGITHLGQKNMGRYKVETLAQHDSMQPYKLELVSYNASCPQYTMRFGWFFS